MKLYSEHYCKKCKRFTGWLKDNYQSVRQCIHCHKRIIIPQEGLER